MGQITKLEMQKKNKNRVNVFVDSVFSFGVELEVALKHNLKKGQELTSIDIEKLNFESDYTRALARAVNLVSKSLKTEKDIIDYLLAKDYTKRIALIVLEKLKEYKLVDDSQYVISFVSSHKDWGIIKLKNKLFSKGVKASIIDEYFSNYCENVALAQKLADKHLKNKERNAVNIQKTKKYLMGRGYTFDSINKINFAGDQNESWD